MRSLVCAIALLSAPAAAQELPQLEDITGQIDGVDIQTSGEIGFANRGEDPIFMLAGRRYQTRLAVDRETLKRLDQCSLRLGGTPCTADISAEIDVDGSFINLLVFDIRNLQRK